jgi:hypothetical protein
MDNSKAYNSPLHPKDSRSETYGCRHSNPDNCAKNHLDLVCAFVRKDNMCKSPPRSWINHFQRLKAPEEQAKASL